MNSTARRLRPFITGEWRALAGSALMTILLVGADLAKPFPIKFVIDHLLTGRTAPFTLTPQDYRWLAVIALVILAISLVEAAGNYFSDLWLQSAGERIAHRLRVALYDHLQRLSLRFHLQREKGDLVTRVTQDVNAIGELFASSLGQIAQSALLLVGMVVVTALLDPILAVGMCVTLPLLGFVSFRYRRRVKASSRLQRTQEGVIASRATEALSAMPVIKAFGSEGLESERVVEPSEHRMAFGIEVAKLQARFDGLVGVLLAIGTALVVVIGAMRVASGALTIGDLVVFTAYVRRANSPMKIMAREWTKVARSMARGERIAEILSVDDVLEDRPGAYSGGRLSGAIELQDVSFAYTDRRPVLEGVDLRIAPGERVALIGPSGAGKSTLVSIIARFHDPKSGRVLFDGREARDCSLRWLRSQVGVLLQDTVLFSGTVDDNIAYACDASADQIAEAARLAAADAFIESLPDGYATELGPQGLGLSGGQRQRLGIARTLLRDPAILILDEPTTGLDAESEAQVLEGLEQLMRGRTTVMITHSLELARRADRLLVVDDGGIAADGPPAELLAEGGAYRRVLEERRRRGLYRRMRLPADRSLPQLQRLLDPGEVAAVLERSLDGSRRVESVAIQRVTYKPQDKAHVHYAAQVDGERHDAVVLADVEADLERRARSAAYREAADLVRSRTPGEPVGYDADLDALVSWLPFDAALPGLVQPPARLVERLQWAGLAVGPTAYQPRLLDYRPRSRAALRLDGHVVKTYGRQATFERAVAGLAHAGDIGAPALELALGDLRLTVQPALDGAAPDDALACAADAGEVLHRLHGAGVAGLEVLTPDALLAEAEERGRIAATLMPTLRDRVDAVLARLAAQVPALERAVPSHGDFRAGRLLATAAGLTVIDFDDMCLADPALDVATYVVDGAHGTGTEERPAAAVLELLLEGYGARPEALHWYLATTTLAHAIKPFRRQVPNWPARVEGMVLAAQEALDS